MPLTPRLAALPADAAFAPGAGPAAPQTTAATTSLRRASCASAGSSSAHSTPHDALHAILDLARFAPSGDNTQPWRFEIHNHHHLTIHGRDTRQDCVYDLRGKASLIAIGALLETVAIAASTHGLRVRFVRREEMAEDHPTIDAYFEHDGDLRFDSLAPHIEDRVTQRRPMRSRKLTGQQLAALTSALPQGYRVEIQQSLAQRWRIAKLLFRSAHIRLTTREAFETHRKVIQWNATFSEDRIPDRAVGVDPLTAKLMRWAMGSFSRIQFLNRFMAGTIAPRLQLDLLPGLRCAGHFFLMADKPAQTMDDHIAAGRALQRFWLTATQQNLLVQPEMTPLIFSQYDRQSIAFSESKPAIARAKAVRDQLEALLTPQVCERTVFMGRIGSGRVPVSRSIRLPLKQLIIHKTD